MSHFFISYKREDADFAELLKNNIKDAGFAVWMDRDGLEAGENWSERIDDVIGKALALIVIMTPESRASEYVTYEWVHAVEVGIKVIPILLRPTDLHPRLKALNYLDFTRRRRWDILINTLNDVAQAHVAQLKASLRTVVEAGNRVGTTRYFNHNSCFRHTIIQSLNEMRDQLASATRGPRYYVPATQYPQYLISLQRELRARVKAIALVDQQERFWQQKTGREIMQTAQKESSRVFVYTTPEQFDENFETLIKYATHYNAYAMSYEYLARKFGLYAKDFSIIEADGSKILADYDDLGPLKTMCFSADPGDVSTHEEALNDIIRSAVPVSRDEHKESDQIRDRVFRSLKLSVFPLRPIEMSGYIPIEDYDEHEERHAYYQEMMQKMLDFYISHHDPNAEPYQILELGAGTGIFTKRLVTLPAIEYINALEIDIVCFSKLQHNLMSYYPLVHPIYEDSRIYSAPGQFKYIFSSFADHHIKLEEKSLYFENIKRNLAPGGRLVVGDEFLPIHDPNDHDAWQAALKAYHGHIIEIAERQSEQELAKIEERTPKPIKEHIEAMANSYRELVKLEQAALQSGLKQQGDFKVSCEQYEANLKACGFEFSKEKIGPRDGDDVGGVYVYIAWLAE